MTAKVGGISLDEEESSMGSPYQTGISTDHATKQYRTRWNICTSVNSDISFASAFESPESAVLPYRGPRFKSFGLG